MPKVSALINHHKKHPYPLPIVFFLADVQMGACRASIVNYDSVTGQVVFLIRKVNGEVIPPYLETKTRELTLIINDETIYYFSEASDDCWIGVDASGIHVKIEFPDDNPSEARHRAKRVDGTAHTLHIDPNA